MNIQQFRKLVAQHQGWIEGTTAYFPSVHHKKLFEEALHKETKGVDEIVSGVETPTSIVEWQLATFPGVLPKAAALRLIKELVEFIVTPTPDEAADCFIVACQLFASLGITDPAPFIDEKMKINRMRQWEIAADGTGQHYETQGTAPDPGASGHEKVGRE